MVKAAVVTGASSGIGYFLTEILLRKGYRVLGVGRNTEKLEELKRKYQPSFTYVTADLREKSSLNV
ncbi:MAG: oxidoreductase, partial [Thermoprotei archaeon]